MAEKNTESTAVNELIQLVATAKPLPADPDEDLMFKAPDKKAARNTRMTATVPPVRGAGEIEPLPRARSPIGTQQGLPTVSPTLKAPPPPVRVSTAPPRTVTIPPLPQAASTQLGFGASAPMTLDDFGDDAEVTTPEPRAMARPTAQGMVAQSEPPPRPSQQVPIASRITKPSLPPPFHAAGSSLTQMPTSRASQPRASLSTTKDFQYPVVQHQPASYPIVQPEMLPAIAQPDLAEAPLQLPSVTSHWGPQESTDQIAKTNDWKSIAGKLIGPMIVLVIAGIFIGGYFAFDGDGGKKKKAPKPAEGPTVSMPVTSPEETAKVAPTPTPAAEAKQEEPKAAPVAVAEPANVEPKAEPAKVEPAKVEPVKVEPAKVEPAKVEPAKVTATEPPKAEPSNVKPTLVDIRIDSNPSGATVNLVDRGKTTYLGTTPVSAAVDASRKYELVFSYENRATVVESLDPSSTKRVNVRLSREKRRSSSSSSEPKKDVLKIETPKFEAPTKTEAPKVEAPPKKEAPTPAVAGDGILMISSKPPCEIHIDGKPTGLTTPQREIKLPAGAHKVTLINSAEGIKKTVSVQINADKPTKVIQDFMNAK